MPKRKLIKLTYQGYYAGFASRLLAFIIDLIILAFVLAIASSFLTFIISFFETLRPSFLRGVGDISNILPILGTVATVIIIASYYIFCWTVIGTTVGGILIGIKIVDSEGRNPSLLRVIVRFLTEFCIPLSILIGAITILFDSKRRAIFDMIAGTYVIYNWEAKPDERALKGLMEKISTKH